MATDVGPSPEISLGSSRRVAVGSACLAALLALGIFAPILYYMGRHWSQVEDYSHGFLIAPLAIYFAWERRRKLRRTPIEPSWWGVVPLLIGVSLLAVGRLGVELTTMRWSFIFALIGIVILLLGIRMFRILAFPLAFLFLMVPLPQSLVNIIAFPLQLLAADTAVSVLHLFGMPVLREGNIIHLPSSTLFVAEACSGLRSLMALGTLGVVFAYFFRKSWIERAILVLLTIPIAVLVNAFRVGLTATLTLRYGPGMADGVIHQTEGFFTFGLAFALLMLTASLLSLILGRIRGKKVSG